MVGDARNGVASSVVVQGDPGIGKSMLLSEAVRGTTGVRVVRVTGFEVEAEIAYGGLQRLGRILSPQLDTLPERQRDALLTATGLRDARPPERPLVALATLTLLAAATDPAPLVLLIDDAHLLDSESLEVLGFVARRISAESLALIFAAREEEKSAMALAGLPFMMLAGLDEAAAGELMHRLTGAALDPAVVSTLVASTGGNPLALSELASEREPHRLTLAAITQSPAPIGKQLEKHYTARVRALTPDARMWLLTAAAESSGDAAVVRAAAQRLGLSAGLSSSLESEQLVEIHDVVQFRHPMIRAAVYNSASDVDRRNVHAALRIETAARGLKGFSAWHAAAAAGGPDSELADELVALADQAGARGGLSSRARLLARAADLSPDPTVRDELLVAASEAAMGAGAARLALELLSRVDPDGLEDTVRGRFLYTRAMSGLFLGDTPALLGGAATMLAAADCFEGVDVAQYQRALLHAFNFAQTAEHMMASVSVEELGRRFLVGADAADGPYSTVLRALGSFMLEPYEKSAPHLADALALLESLDDSSLLEFSFCSVAPAIGLWDPDAAARLLTRTIAVARDRGAIREADAALWVLSAVELTRADPRAAHNAMEEGGELRRAVGYQDEQVVNAALLAWQDASPETVQQIADALAGLGWFGVWRMAAAAIAIGQIADGDFEGAYVRLEHLVARPFLQAGFHQLPEYVEAAVKTGRRAEASTVAAELRRFAEASGRPWAAAMSARCEALLTESGDEEKWHLASIAHIDATSMTGEQGRARLMYGEWLRRNRRRSEARHQLFEALRVLDRAGAVRFARRARRELDAMGESSHASPTLMAELTAQEAVVARLAANGATNPEIGATLFISRNTVDYHLRKIFRKLGVNSRRQLADALTER
jgi:DNA-binding CsgD family transcriptional regulator